MSKHHFIAASFFVLLASGISAQITTDTVRLKVVEITDSLASRTPFVSIAISKKQLLLESTRDIGDYLRSIPNIAGIRKGGGAVDPVIRGFKFSQLNVVMDGGVKIENGCPNRMDPVSSHIEVEDIDKINVVKGPFLLKYGPALGGVIDLQTENPHPYPEFEVHANALLGYESNCDGQKEHLSIYGGNQKIYFLGTGGFRKYGNYKSGSNGGVSNTYKTSFEKYNFAAKAGYAIGSDQHILLSYNVIQGRDILFPALTMDEKSDDTRIMAIDYAAKNMPGIIKALDAKVYRSVVHHLMDNSNRETWAGKQMVSDVDAINTGGKAAMGMKFNKHNVTAGIDFENIYKDGTRIMTMQMMGTTSTKRFNLWNAATIQNTGLFTSYNTTFKSFVFDAALRVDFNTADSEDTLKLIKNGVEYYNKLNSKFVNISANLAVTHKLSNNLSVSIAVARGTRSPNMLERFIKLLSVGYDNYDYLGNPQLRPETNNEADLTLKYSDMEFGSLYINGFYAYVQDYISAVMLPSSVITPGTLGAPGVKQFVNVDYVTFTGFETGYASPEIYKLGGSLVAAFTYGIIPATTKYLLTGNQVTGEMRVENDALPEIPPFEATMKIHYKLLKGKLVPKVSYRFVAQQKHVSQAFYEPETPGFSLLNITVSYEIDRHIGVNTGVNNIFDKSYYEHLNRKITGSTEKLYEPGRVFFIQLNIEI